MSKKFYPFLLGLCFSACVWGMDSNRYNSDSYRPYSGYVNSKQNFLSYQALNNLLRNNVNLNNFYLNNIFLGNNVSLNNIPQIIPPQDHLSLKPQPSTSIPNKELEETFEREYNEKEKRFIEFCQKN